VQSYLTGHPWFEIDDLVRRFAAQAAKAYA
jgi:hypothetical protein